MQKELSDSIKKIVALNIKFIRKSDGYTQQEFADKIGVKRSLIGAVEEERAISIDIIYKVSEMYGYLIDDILKRPLKDLG